MKDRHQCEVRYCLALRVKDRNKALAYIAKIKEARGEAGKRLERDVMRQWQLGNRGEQGRWETEKTFLAEAVT